MSYGYNHTAFSTQNVTFVKAMIIPVQLGAYHCSDAPLLRQPVIPMAHYSDDPLFRQPITPMAHFFVLIIIYGNGNFLSPDPGSNQTSSLTMVTSAPCILNATVNVRTNLYNFSCTSTYGVLLCVKFNKNTLDGFEGLQDLWTDGQGDSYIPPIFAGVQLYISS